MHRLFLLIFLLPWYAVAVLTALMLWFATSQMETDQDAEAQKAQALQADMPLPVPIDQFAQTDRHIADEVHVTAWINLAHNYRLTHRGKFGTDEWMMYVLFGPDDPDTGKVARGVALIDPDRIDDFALIMVDALRPEMGSQLNFDINGQALGDGDYSSLVTGALKEHGLTKDPDFLVIAPFIDGRAAGLAPDPLAVMHRAGGAFALATGLALLTLVKLRRWRKRRAAPDPAPAQGFAPVPVPRPTPGPAPVAPDDVVARPNAERDWSPIQSVMSRHAGRQTSLTATDPGARATSNDSPIRVVSRFDGLRQLVPWGVGGVVALLLFAATDVPRQMPGISPTGTGETPAQMTQAPPPDAQGAAHPSGPPAPEPTATGKGQEMLGDPERSVLSMLLHPSDRDLLGLFVTFAAAVPLMALHRLRRRKAAEDDPWDRRLR